MVLMIDTNILLDVLQEREPHLELSLRIWSLCDYDKSVTGYILSASLLNIAYIMRKELTPDRIQEMYMTLVPAFKFIDLRESDLEGLWQVLQLKIHLPILYSILAQKVPRELFRALKLWFLRRLLKNCRL